MQWFNRGEEVFEEPNFLHINDVLDVAKRLGVSLTVAQFTEVIKMYPFEEENDPTGTWDLIVENCIYNVLNG